VDSARIREPDTAIATNGNEVVRSTGAASQQEDVVAAQLGDGPGRAGEVKSNVDLEVLLDVPLNCRVSGINARRAVEGHIDLAEDLEALGVVQVHECLRCYVAGKHVRDSSRGTVALCVLHHIESHRGRADAGSGGVVRGIQTKLDALDHARATNAGGLGDTLWNEYQLTRHWDLARCINVEVDSSVEELSLCSTTHEAAVNTALAVVTAELCWQGRYTANAYIALAQYKACPLLAVGTTSHR